MKIAAKILRVICGVLSVIVLLFVLATLITSVSPIYNFAEPQPFSGPDIYDPYRDLDTITPWRRVNLHTHTRVEGPLNECEYGPEEVLRRYDAFDYDYVGISNHNEITPHPEDVGPTIYEHGYNTRNFHKLVIGSDHVNRFDAIVPLFTSQLQWQLDMLKEEGVLLQVNHPRRTTLFSEEALQALSGYHIIELSDVEGEIENRYWDWALGAGHYCLGLFNDDLHFPDRTTKMAVRCSFWSMPTITKESIMQTLRGGCFYSMRVPDYGNGDWNVKYERNRSLPRVRDIGLRGDTIYMELTAMADSIVVYGNGGATLARATATESLEYRFGAQDSYARFVAYMPERAVIMSNPFARYDASMADMPAQYSPHSINIPFTALYNFAIAVLLVAFVRLYIKFLKRWRRAK